MNDALFPKKPTLLHHLLHLSRKKGLKRRGFIGMMQYEGHICLKCIKMRLKDAISNGFCDLVHQGVFAF